MVDTKQHWLSDVLRWTPATRPDASQIIAAMLGLAGPIIAGVATDHLRLGMVAAIGGLALGGASRGATLRQRAFALAAALLAGCAAISTGTSIASHGSLIIVAVPGIAAIAGLIGGISLPMARETTRFILFTTIAAGLSAPNVRPLGMTLLFFLGGTWTLSLSLLLSAVFGRARHAAESSVAQPPQRPVALLLSRWRESLFHLSGWQYPIRIWACLTVAEAIAQIWPGQHGQWIAVTVAIVLGRRLPAPPTRLLQRALGTMLGVVVAGLLLIWNPSPLIVTGEIAALAAARPVLRAGNYAAYAVIMTPLIVLLLDFGQAVSVGILVDRLTATIAGCLITLLFGYLPWTGCSFRRAAPSNGER
jgi:fusaric acid resistance family protein